MEVINVGIHCNLKVYKINVSWYTLLLSEIVVREMSRK